MAGWYLLYSPGDNLRSLRAARNADGRLEIFGINAGGQIFHTWQTAPSNGWVGQWQLLFSPGDNLAMLDVVSNADGRLEVFGVNGAGNIFHTWQTAPSNGWAGQWDLLYSPGDNLRSLRAVRNADGRLEVFGVNAAGQIFHTWQTAPSNGWNGAWDLLYSPGDNLAMLDVVSNADGRLEVFGVNGAGNIFHTWQTAPSNGWIGDWRYLGLAEQHQQQTEWCWSATTVSINLYYNSASTWTQCSLVNRAFSQTTCCQDGSTSACNQPWYPDQALTITGNLSSTANGKPSFQTVMNEINAGHPVSIAIYWNGGGGHNPAVDGYQNDAVAPTIDIEDPWYGQSLNQDFNSFPSNYNGGATWGESYFTTA